jgi:hypothetical protein
MSHCLIVGMTESGKTTLAKRLAARYKSNGVPVIVLDSLNDPEWNGDFQTTDPDEFLRVFWASKRCACFIDEAGDAVGRYNTVMQRTATRGRHWGHAVHFISQRSIQLAPTVRDQCGHIFLLTSSVKDGKVHADEWNQPKLATCNQLKKGNYFHCTRFGELQMGSLFGIPQGSNTDGTDSDTRDGGRNLSGEKEGLPDSAPSRPEESSGDGDHARSDDRDPSQGPADEGTAAL